MAYLRLAVAGFHRWSTYRQAAIAGLLTNCVFGFLRCAVLLTVFAAGAAATGDPPEATVSGYDAAQTVTFVWVGQGLIAVVLLWDRYQLAERVRSGDVAIDLARPWDLQLALLAEDLGRAGFAVLTRGLIPVLVGLAFFPVRVPSELVSWLAFAVSLTLAVVVSFAVRLLLNLTAFWLLDIRGVAGLYVGVSGLFVGLSVPISFYPQWLEIAIWCTPFPAIMQVPIDVFAERHDTAILLLTLGHQALWATVLLGLGRWVLRRAERRVVIQGG